jgi:hypothetical protein
LSFDEFCKLCQETGLPPESYLDVASYLYDVGDIVVVLMHHPTLIVTDPQRMIEVLRCDITTNLEMKAFNMPNKIKCEFIVQLKNKTFTFSLKVLIEL